MIGSDGYALAPTGEMSGGTPHPRSYGTFPRVLGAYTREERLLGLLPHLPPGVSDLYCHPATRMTAELAADMPAYRHPDELAALVSPAVRRRIEELGIGLIGYRDL